MITRLINNELAITWLELFVKYGMFAILLPIATVSLSTEELSLFLYLNTLVALAYLAEGGANRTVLRAMAYFMKGAVVLPQKFEEAPVQSKNKSPSLKQISKLKHNTFYMFLVMAFLSALILLTIGYQITKNIISMQENLWLAELSFLILVAFTFNHILLQRWVGLLQGAGYLIEQKKIEVVIGFTRELFTGLSLLLGFGVIGVVIIRLLSDVVFLVLLRKAFNMHFPIHYKESTIEWSFIKSLIPSMWRQSAMTLAGYLIYQGSAIVIAQLNDAAMIASYLLTIQIVIYLKNISNTPCYAYYPKIADAVASQNKSSFLYLLTKSLKISFILYITGGTVLLIIGNPLLELVGSQTKLLSFGLLLFLLLVYLLELNHIIHTAFYSATNHIPFVIPWIISGLSIVIGAWFLVGIYGVLGVVIVQFIVQLAFNNWYPVYLNLNLLKKLK